MSKERKFHELIEQQNQEEKNRVWEKICQRRAEEGQTEQENEPALPKEKSRPFLWRKWGAVAASSLVVIILGTVAAVKFFPFGEEPTDNSGRYFTTQSYDLVDTSTNLKDYAQQIGKNLLYFDWYVETDHCKNQAWQLKDTGEIICYSEEMIDINTGCMIYLFVTEMNTEIEGLGLDENTRVEEIINEITIQWKYDDDRAWANFEYQDYNYYLRLDEPMDENHILTLVEELLP